MYRLRTEAGLSQAELARRMGTTQAAISRMEGGGGGGRKLDTLQRLAEALDRRLVLSFARAGGDVDEDSTLVLG